MKWPILHLLQACQFAFCLMLAVVIPAHAGRSCEQRAPDAQAVVKAMDLAFKVRQALDESGAEVAFVARVGQDLSKYHLRYSHMAFVWRDHPKGRWLVVHELNACGTALSDLFDEGLGNFFMDDMFAYESKILLPSAESQKKIIKVLAASEPKALHWPQYNMLAFPFSSKYQNSNQWVLETYASAQIGQAGVTRDEAQAWLKNAGYQPITLNISAISRLGGRMFRANIAFDDQPFERRMAGKIDTVTVDSVYRFLRQREVDLKEIELRLP